MATSRSGAGGKIVTNRRKQRLSATPHDRPPLPNPPPSRSHWLTGLIIPSARAIASGAGKIVSSILSDSESSSDEDSVSEDDDGNDNEYENQLGVQRTKTKHIIEQLIMQETFSREECDSLVKVLNSRVTDRPIGAGEKSLLDGSPEKPDDHGDADLYNKALLEAKKWFEDKKAGSSSRTELVQRSFNTNSTGLQHVQNEGGSPVDVARSYMKERPPWASPTKNIDLGTPSASTMKSLNERTGSVGHDSFSLSKKQTFLASGSWNIQEELGRVRSKATEDMLRTPPSNINPLWFAAATTRQDSAGASKVVSVVGEKTSGPKSFRKSKQINALVVDAGVSYDLAQPAVESRQDGKPSKTPSSKPATSVSGNNETSEAAVQMDECVAPNFSHPSSSTHAEEQHTVPQACKPNGSSATEVAECGAKQNANGPLSSQESLSAGVATVENHEQHDENNNQNGDSITEKNSENLTEAYVEVPIVTETTTITSGSLDVQYQEPSVGVGQPSKKGKAETVAGKQQGRKPSKVSRRGRGRGK